MATSKPKSKPKSRSKPKIKSDPKPVVTGCANHDGLYEYTGLIREAKADQKDHDAFSKAAELFSVPLIRDAANNQSLQLDPVNIEVRPSEGAFTITMKDADWTESYDKAKQRDLRAFAKRTGGPRQNPRRIDISLLTVFSTLKCITDILEQCPPTDAELLDDVRAMEQAIMAELE